MRTAKVLILSLGLSSLLCGLAAAAPALDAAGKCRDNGKFVEARMCQTAAASTGKCRDIKTKKFAKCGTAGTEPVPSTTANSSAPAGATSGATKPATTGGK